MIFWIVKGLATGMGETTSDVLVHTIDPPVAVVIGLAGFVAVLTLRLRAARYNAWICRFAVVMVSVLGTMAGDVAHGGLGIPCAVSTPFFGAALAVIFPIWVRVAGTLPIHSIHSRRREAFYWATVLATFALGTTTGDMTVQSMQLGYRDSGILFAALIAAPALARWRFGPVEIWLAGDLACRRFGLPEIPAFWVAYIVTRPFAASVADRMGVDHQRGGLDWGTGPVSLALCVVILGFVACLAANRSDVEHEPAGVRDRDRADIPRFE